MKFRRRQFLHLAAGTVAVSVMSRIARAQTYPTRPITMIVPFPAGGGTDVIARPVAERMRERIGQPIIIENVGGADGSIGVGRAARARPDGYTLCVGTLGTHVQNGAFYSLPYDVLHGFVPITALASIPYVLFARKGIPADNLKDLVVWLILSEANRDAICHCSVSCGRLRDRGFSCWPDRSCNRHTDSIAAGSIGEHQGLCGDK